MRIGLSFAINNRFPLSNRLGILSFIKEAIRTSSEEYYDDMFVRRKREMKPFVFSTFFRDMTIERDQILASQMELTVSSNDHALLLHLYNGALRNKHYRYRDYLMELKDFQLLPTHMIKVEEVAFRFASPLLVENKQGKPVSPGTTEYEQELNYISNLALQAYMGRPLHRQIRILDQSLKKQVIKENFHQADDRPLYFTTYKGIIKLSGHPEDLQCLYDCGMGRRTNQGFGLAVID